MAARGFVHREELLDLLRGRRIVEITQKWVTVRDKYTVDVAPGTNPGFALALMWAVDRWVERD
ncbi:hypothetical protein GCM10025865_11830 [Paraoerskovia sediminicola]|uniref:Uncharacterized protein n=1 Tax=Paraoerskovia sediminicola TaxID=1138587 RepID=A0ABN6XAM1_9CELL|nr:hypothetical protein GCM10025865_11830 [Paraoerskovia sediminicola]